MQKTESLSRKLLPGVAAGAVVAASLLGVWLFRPAQPSAPQLDGGLVQTLGRTQCAAVPHVPYFETREYLAEQSAREAEKATAKLKGDLERTGYELAQARMEAEAHMQNEMAARQQPGDLARTMQALVGLTDRQRAKADRKARLYELVTQRGFASELGTHRWYKWLGRLETATLGEEAFQAFGEGVLADFARKQERQKDPNYKPSPLELYLNSKLQIEPTDESPGAHMDDAAAGSAQVPADGSLKDGPAQ